MPFKWTPETRQRALLLAKEMPITDIAYDLGASHETIREFLFRNGVQPLRMRAKADKSALKAAREARKFQAKPPIMVIMGLRFEDVTREEARKISADAPRSGKPARHLQKSVIGCAAAMCVQP